MALLEKIPDDILYQIVLSFEGDARFLCTITTVCWAFRRATRKLIFRLIRRLPPQREQLLERTFSEDPDLLSSVHSYMVSIANGTILDNGLEKASRFPNLRELLFDKFDKRDGFRDAVRRFAYGKSIDEDFECGFVDEYAWTGIRSIRLTREFSTTEIVRFMLLPHVKRLTARSLDKLNEPRLPKNMVSRKSQLTSLDITGGGLWNIHPNTLKIMLSYCPGLHHLGCQIPVITKPEHFEIRSSKVVRPVSPEGLSTMLEPVRATLESLMLIQVRHHVEYDGSHIDLSGFTRLVDLEITACCLFPPGPPCKERDDMYTLLPPNIQYLKIDFPRETGIFYHHIEGEIFKAQDPQNIPPSRYSWLQQFPAQKVGYFPHLSRIKMMDPPGNIGYWRWLNVRWIPPPSVESAFFEAGIDLSVNVSFPNPYSELESWNERRCKPRYGLFAWDP